MSAKSTTTQLFVKPLQFLEETTEGQTNSSGSQTFAAVGASSTLSIDIDGQFVDISQIGPEDLHSITQGMAQWETRMTYQMVDSTFAKYAVNAANYATPAGTISKTLTILFSIYLNGSESYVLMKGSRARQITITMENGRPTVCSIDFVHTTITTPGAHGIAGTPVFVTTFPTGAVFDWLSGGADPLSWNSNAQNAKRFSITINRNTTLDFTLGNTAAFGSQPHGRRISGDFSVLWTSTTLETDFKAGTERTLAIVLKTAVSTLTVTGAKIVRHTKEFDGDDTEALLEVCGFRGRAVTIT
jgi:hypothetical protein